MAIQNQSTPDEERRDAELKKHFIPEPPAEKVINVGQHDFGYLAPDIPKEYLVTYGLNTCKGVYLFSPGLQVLHHAVMSDSEWGEEGMSAMLGYLAGKGLMRKRFNKGVIVGSGAQYREIQHHPDGTSWCNTLANEYVPEVLRNACKRLEFVVAPGEGYASVMFDRKGRIHWVYQEDYNTGSTSSNFLFRYPSGTPEGETGLVCATNGDYIPVFNGDYTPVASGDFAVPEHVGIAGRLMKHLFRK